MRNTFKSHCGDIKQAITITIYSYFELKAIASNYTCSPYLHRGESNVSYKKGDKDEGAL